MKMLGFPRKPWLLNRVSLQSWPMKQTGPFPLANTITVDTGGRLGRNPLRRTVLDTEVRCGSENSVILGGVYVQLPDFKRMDRKWITDRLDNAKLYLSVDGEDLVIARSLGSAMCADKDDMLGGAWPFEADVNNVSFVAVIPIGHDLGKGYDKVGAFLVDRTIVRAYITGIPSGAGEVRIETGCISALYEVAE